MLVVIYHIDRLHKKHYLFFTQYRYCSVFGSGQCLLMVVGDDEGSGGGGYVNQRPLKNARSKGSVRCAKTRAVCCNVANTTMKLLYVTVKCIWGTKEVCNIENKNYFSIIHQLHIIFNHYIYSHQLHKIYANGTR